MKRENKDNTKEIKMKKFIGKTTGKVLTILLLIPSIVILGYTIWITLVLKDIVSIPGFMIFWLIVLAAIPILLVLVVKKFTKTE